MYDYYLAYDNGNVVIRDKDDADIERFDHSAGEWVTDWDMCGIYSGDIPAEVITEEEAMRRINAR